MRKVPEDISPDNFSMLWLCVFNAWWIQADFYIFSIHSSRATGVFSQTWSVFSRPEVFYVTECVLLQKNLSSTSTTELGQCWR